MMAIIDESSQVKQKFDGPEFAISNTNLNLNSSSNYVSSYVPPNPINYPYPSATFPQNPYNQYGYPQGYDQNKSNYPTNDPKDSYIMQTQMMELNHSLARESEANKVDDLNKLILTFFIEIRSKM